MKAFSVLALFYVFVSVTLAVPIPGGDKGKGKAVDPPTPDNSRPSTPTPEPPLSHPPLPGRTGHHTANGVTTAYYGDDNIPGHMRHVQRNHALHPGNANPAELAHDGGANRREALKGIPTHKGDLVRDEKNPAMFHNPHHDKTTTVEYRDPKESSKEGGLLSGTKKAMEDRGKGALGQIRANPGWHPLDPSQRRGHEAPARLNSQTHNGLAPQHAPKKQSKKVEKPEHKPEGYTPVTKGGMELRHRPAQDPPPPPKTPPKKKPAGSATNLQPGTPPKPPGHVFKGTNEERPERASHHGAPAPPSNSHQRHPPRPQNQAHHEKMQKEEAAKKAAQGHGGHSRPQYAGTVPHGVDSARYHSNLERFNQNHPHTPGVGNGHGRPAEAPARLGTHHTNQPSTSHHGASTSHNPPAHGAHHPAPAPHTNLAHRPAAPHSPPQTPTPSSKKKNGKK